MSELLHADIFFFISSIVVIILGLATAIVIYYIIVILRDLREISRKMREVSYKLENDFDDLRADIKKEGLRVRTIFELVLAFIRHKIPKTKNRKIKEEN